MVSGVTVKLTSSTSHGAGEDATIAGAHQAAAPSWSRPDQACGDAHAAWYLDHPPLVVDSGSRPASSCWARCSGRWRARRRRCRRRARIARPWARLRRSRSSEFASSAVIRPMIATTSWPGLSTSADSTA